MDGISDIPQDRGMIDAASQHSMPVAGQRHRGHRVGVAGEGSAEMTFGQCRGQVVGCAGLAADCGGGQVEFEGGPWGGGLQGAGQVHQALRGGAVALVNGAAPLHEGDTAGGQRG